MMKPVPVTRLALTCVVLFAIHASGCHGLQASGRGGGDPALEVKAGRTVTVSLSSNPSTGYSWTWTNRANFRHVDTTGWSFDTGRPGVPGAGGTERWTFKGVSKGSDTVRMEYRRPWEKIPAVRDTSIVIRVR